MSDQKGGKGLHGRDRQQSGLRDTRGGTYDGDDPGLLAETGESPRADAPQGGPGRKIADLPDGLRRPRVGPYDKDAGRKKG